MNNTVVKGSETEIVHKDFIELVTDFWNGFDDELLYILIFIVLFLFCIAKKRSFMTRHLKSMALIIFLSGLCLYCIGFNHEGCKDNAFPLFFRAVLSSVEMFASHSDLIEVSEDCKFSDTYMILFSTTHFLAVFVSAFFIIKLFGYRIYSWISVKLMLIEWKIFNAFLYIFPTYKGNKKDSLFVLWGVNNNSVTLAESISKKLTDRNALIVLVITPNDARKKITASRFSFSNFFHLSSDSVSNYIDRIENIDAILMNTDSTINQHVISGVKKSNQFYNNMSLKALGKIVKHFAKLKRNMSFYFLSDDENENIEAVNTFKILAKQTHNDSYHSGSNFHIYCHARRNYFNVNVLMNNELHYKVSLIDTSMLAIRQLKRNRELQPVSFVDIDYATGEVLTPYECLIIGFGETGRDALRFLYEFSSFVGKDGKESMRKFYIVDKNLTQTRSAFLYSAPAMAESNEIEWWDDCNSTHEQTFWDRLEVIIDKINCIMVCVDCDEEAKLLVGQLYDFVYRRRTNMSKFIINVRVQDSLYETQINNFKNNTCEKIINTFGTADSIFDYSVLSSDLLEDEAKRFYYRYKLETNILETKQLVSGFNISLMKINDRSVPYYEKYRFLWNYRRMYLDATIDYNDHDEPFLLKNIRRKLPEDFIEVQYQESQDVSNAWHRETKCMLAGLYNISDLNLRLKRLDELITLSTKRWKEIKADESADSILIENLDACEHLRWNAKMMLMGFSYAPRMEQPEDVDTKTKTVRWKRQIKVDTMRKRTHHCIQSYHDLSHDSNLNDTLDYDQGVVKLSFVMMADEIREKIRIEKSRSEQE